MILLIDNYDSFVYNLYQSVAAFYSDIKVVRHDQITVEEVKRLQPAGIILSPGPGKPEDAGICVELVRSAYTTIPILGVCLGLQALTIALGGKVVQAPEIMHGKQELVFHCRRGLYHNLPLPFQAGRYHSLMVERATLPDTLCVEAETASGLIMGIRHATFPVFGVQFHPESILTPMGNRLLQNFVTQIREVKK